MTPDPGTLLHRSAADIQLFFDLHRVQREIFHVQRLEIALWHGSLSFA